MGNIFMDMLSRHYITCHRQVYKDVLPEKTVTRCMKSGPDISTAKVIESFKIKIKSSSL